MVFNAHVQSADCVPLIYTSSLYWSICFHQAFLTSAQASYAYVYACVVGEGRPGFFYPSRPGWETGHNHTPPLNLFRAFPCAPPYARSIFWWSPLLLLSWSPSHGNYPFIEHPPDMHVQHFWICNISLRISIATRKIPFRSCDCWTDVFKIEIHLSRHQKCCWPL